MLDIVAGLRAVAALLLVGGLFLPPAVHAQVADRSVVVDSAALREHPPAGQREPDGEPAHALDARLNASVGSVITPRISMAVGAHASLGLGPLEGLAGVTVFSSSSLSVMPHAGFNVHLRPFYAGAGVGYFPGARVPGRARQIQGGLRFGEQVRLEVRSLDVGVARYWIVALGIASPRL